MGPHKNFAESQADDALEALRWHWGDAYDILVIDGAWLARRHDGIGATIEAAGPEDLGAAISQDYSAHPVPRPGTPW